MPAVAFDWVNLLQTTGNDFAASVTRDSTGNLYESGASNNHMFLRKFDSAGTVLWSSPLSANMLNLQKVVVDAQDQVYVTGQINPDPSDLFVAKLDPTDGHALWTRTMGGPGNDGAQNLAVDHLGNVYFTGAFRSTADFGSGWSLTVGSGADINGFIAKLDPADGHTLWAYRAGNNATSVAVDSMNNILVGAQIRSASEAYFGASANATTVTSYSGYDAAIAKYSPSGALAWVKSWACQGYYDNINAVQADANDNLIASLHFSGAINLDPNNHLTFPVTPPNATNVAIVKLNSDGNFVWGSQQDVLGGGDINFSSYNDLAVDSSNQVYAAYMSRTTSSPSEDWDTKIVKFDGTNGTPQWTAVIGGTASDTRANGISVDAQGHIFLAGNFTSTTDFDPGAGTQNRSSAGGNDAYLLQLSQGLAVGDLVVIDQKGASPSATASRVIKVNPVTGNQTLIAQDGFLDSPQAVVVERLGDRWGTILVGDASPDALHPAQIVRIDPITDVQSVLSEGGLLKSPYGMAIDTAGNILVADPSYTTGAATGAVIKIDPLTGAQSVAATGGFLTGPSDVAFDAAGNMFVANFVTIDGVGRLRVVKVDATGTQTLISAGSLSSWNGGIVVDAAGGIFASEIYYSNGIFRIDPTTGAQTVLTQYNNFEDPWDLDIDLSGNLVVADGEWWSPGRIIKVDPGTGAQTSISSGGLLVDPMDIAVVRPMTVTPVATSTAISAPLITYGAHGLVTVTVSSAAGTPTGTVTLVVDNGAPLVQALSGGSTTFDVGIVTAGDHNLSANYAAQSTFDASIQTGILHVNQADASVTINPYSGTYDAAAHNLTGSVTGVAGDLAAAGSSLTFGASYTDAGNYTGTWTFEGGVNYLDESGSAAIDIAQAQQTIAFAPLGDRTYGDADFPVSAMASSNLPVTFSIVAGGQYASIVGNMITILGATPANTVVTVEASQAGNSNYSVATPVDQSFTISKADATVVVTPYSVDYDGSPHAATVTSIIGVNGETWVTVGIVTLNTTHIDAGTYSSDSWSFTGAANYNDITSTTITDTINKANATVVVTPYTGVYDGYAHGATGVAVGVNREDLSNLLNLGASFTDVPGGTALWVFAGNGNYLDESGSAAIDIAQAQQTIAFAPLGDRTFGDADFTVSATASSSLPVTFTASGKATVEEVDGVWMVHITGTGSATIIAHQSGDGNYNAAADVAQTFTIQPSVNHAPVANNFTVAINTSTATIAVLAHASDPDSGDTLTVSGVTQGAQGTVVVNRDGTITYTLTKILANTDSFTYTVSDGHGGTATAKVTINLQLPPTQVVNLIQTQIQNLSLPAGQKTALIAELEVAQFLIEHGLRRVADVPLTVFRLHVRLLERQGRIDHATADLLANEVLSLARQLS